jgi:hypothetical protein
VKLFKTLEALMPQDICKRMGYLGDAIKTRQFCNYYTKMHDVELYQLKDLPLTRWNFGGEFFEVLIVEDDSFLEKPDQIKLVKKALQREQKLIFISQSLKLSDLETKLEGYGFHDFKSVDSDPHICTVSKWFAL